MEFSCGLITTGGTQVDERLTRFVRPEILRAGPKAGPECSPTRTSLASENHLTAVACNVVANAFVPVRAQTTVPFAAAIEADGKFTQPITTSVPPLSER